MANKNAITNAVATKHCWISPDKSEIRWILPLHSIGQTPPEGYCVHQIDITVSFRTPGNIAVLDDVVAMLQWACERNKGEYVGPIMVSLQSDARDVKYMVRSFSVRRAQRMAEWLTYIGGTIIRCNVTYASIY